MDLDSRDRNAINTEGVSELRIIKLNLLYIQQYIPTYSFQQFIKFNFFLYNNKATLFDVA